MLTSGQLIAERYRLARRIAVGGMGEVWEAADTRLDRLVAVKVLKAELSGDAEFLHRFRTEARTTASLNHPGIASVHDYGETAAVPDGPQDTAYLVMELVEGEPLAGILASERRINAERTLDILEQAGHALQAAHERGLVHRDVKPGNILVAPNGTVKLTDFGIAKAADAAPVTRNGMVMGTAHYIAPEQALGHEAAPASDVYSLAVCGYECLAGQRPFLSDNAVTVAMMHIRDAPPPLPPDVPPHARAVIDATLVKDPKQRYGTGGEFANAIAAVRAGYALPAPLGLGGPGAGPGGPNGMAAPGIPAQAPAQPSLATQQAQQAQAQAQQAQAQLGQAQPGPPAMPSHPVPGMPGPQTGHHAPVAQPGTGAFPMSAPIPQPMPPARRAGRNTGWWVLLIVLALLLVVLGVVGLTVLANAAQTDRPHHPQASVGDDTGRRPTHGEGRNVFISEPSKYTLGSRA